MPLRAGLTGLGAPRRAGERARLLAACRRYRERLANELGLDADFVCADVYDAFGALGERRFDIVYTGLGSDLEHAAGFDQPRHRPRPALDVGQPVHVGLRR